MSLLLIFTASTNSNVHPKDSSNFCSAVRVSDPDGIFISKPFLLTQLMMS